MLFSVALLAQLTIVATATDTVRVDGYAEVQVRVTARGNRVPDVTAPGFPAFLVLRTESSQHLQSAGTGARMVTELQYTLVPTREGRFKVPPFVARVGREVARSKPLTIVVLGGSAASRAPPPVPEIVARAPLDSASPVSFHALAVPETVYVGQQSTYQLAVFLNGSARSRVRRLEAIAPEMPGLLAYDPPGGMEEFERTGPGGISYEAHVYQRPVFPLTAGPITIPPARLTYAIPVSPSFFSREEHHDVHSPPVTIVAIDPPAENRPPDYDGAVGTLRISARLDSAGRVGEPLTLRVTLAGAGNVKLWPRPRVDASWAHVVLFQDRVRLDSDAQSVQGEKEFEFLLTPQRDGPVVLPPIRYSYWNPVAEEYQFAETRPETLQVSPGRLARTERVEKPGTRLELRRVYRGPLPSPWHERPVIWGLLAAIPLPALALAVRRRPRPTRAPVRSRPAGLRALSRVPDEADPARVRRELARAVRVRLQLPESHSGDPEALARAARRDGVTPETAARLRTLLIKLEQEAFSGITEHAELRVREAERVFAAIDREARYHPRVRRTRTVPVAIIAILALAGTVSASWVSVPANAERDFARGVREYESGDFESAVRAFGSATRAERAAPDAWANLGTAAWATADTARAVQGWMRALALEPTARDARERLGLTPAGRDLEWRIPRASPDMLLIVGAALWLGCWGWATYRLYTRRRVGGMALAGIGAATVVFAMIAPLNERLAARDRAVVVADTPLRSTPRLSTERWSVARTGEVVRVLSRDGVWARVAIEDARAGWLPASTLLSLERD